MISQDTLSKIKDKRADVIRWLLIIWQFVCVVMVSVGNWPVGLVWLSLAASLIFILYLPLTEGLLLAVVSMPFYVALPLGSLDTVPIWRVLFLALFAKWLFLQISLKQQPLFFYWDKWLGLFAGIALLTTLFFGHFRLEGLKQILFLFNAWLIYPVIINVIGTKEEVVRLVKAAVVALTIIITLGYVQLFITFFAGLDVFWVYWASYISKLFYGTYFASVSLYSNSWFSFSGGSRDLRMFSIMPDSQSFAYLSAFGLGLGTAATYAVGKRLGSWLWSGIRFAGLAIMLSGTRAVWVGMVVPFFAICLALMRDFLKPMAKKFFWAFLIILVLFFISPVFNKGLQYLRFGPKFQENFMDRAKSIYNINETSNAGRIEIWKSSLRYAVSHPWGAGLKNFIVSQSAEVENPAQYQDLARKHNQRYNLPQGYVSAHSLYLQVLVETGLLGLLSFVWFWFVVLNGYRRFLKLHRHDNNFWIFYLFQCSLVFIWILASGFFDITLFNDKVLILFFLSLGLSGVIIKNYDSWGELNA